MISGARFGRRAWLGILCVQLLSVPRICEPADAATDPSDDAVKAAYLYRFAGYVQWPSEEEAGRPFVVAVVDAPGVARELRHLVSGRRINDRVIEVVETRRVLGADGMAILFIGAGHAALLRRPLAQIEARSVLVVSDQQGGLDAGSTINFLLLDHRVRFEVSLTEADRAQLKISAQLLGVAVRVLGGGRRLS